MNAIAERIDRINPYALLGASIALEVAGATLMKLSEGFSLLPFTLATAACYLATFALLTFTLKHLPLGLAYGIWGGVGTVGTAVIGIALFGDPFGWATCLGLALVVGGIVLLNQGPSQRRVVPRAADPPNSTRRTACRCRWAPASGRDR